MFKIVVSGVNLTDSGKLSVLQDCLSTLKQIKTQKKLDVTVLVHRTQLVKDYQDDFTIIEYPEVKSSWFKRINFEYFHSKTLSLQIKPHLWINLHDVSANVICPYKVVYCHNPSPFYKIDYQNFFIDITFSMFCLFYKYLYGINIKSNSFV
ncbi:MAG: glycosyltransferase family 1 protein, partial [Sphingobacteriaceae bacterium]